MIHMLEPMDNIPTPESPENGFEKQLPEPDTNSYDPEREAALRRGMRRQFNQLGWAFVTMLLVWVAIVSFAAIAAVLIEKIFDIPAVDAYYRYYLLINEASLAIAIFIGGLILRPASKCVPEKQPFSAGRFIKLLMVCFAVAIVGNIVGILFLAVWNAITGSSVGNTVSELIADENPWMMLLTVGILAPVLEELFFRKWLIDRTRQYGEKICIILSASMFALFHMNFSQFFYAFAVGLILAYIYCRSGKIWIPMLLHAIFNCCLGVLNSLISSQMLKITEKIPNLTPDEMMALPSNELLLICLVGLYYLLFGVMVIVGLVILCIQIKRVRFRPAETPLPVKSRSAIFGNAGMIVAIVFTAAMTIYSLFT